MAMKSLQNFFLNVGHRFAIILQTLCQCGTIGAKDRAQKKNKQYRQKDGTSFEGATNCDLVTFPAEGPSLKFENEELQFTNKKTSKNKVNRPQGDSIKQKPSKEMKQIKQTTSVIHREIKIKPEEPAEPLINDNHIDFKKNFDRDSYEGGQMTKNMETSEKDLNLISGSYYRSSKDISFHKDLIHAQNFLEQKQLSSKDGFDNEDEVKRLKCFVSTDQQQIPKYKDSLQTTLKMPLPKNAEGEHLMRKPITNRSKVKGSPAVVSSSPNEGREVKEDSNTPHMEGSLSKVKKTTVIVNGLYDENKDKSRKTSDSSDQKPIPNYEDSLGTRSKLSLKGDLEDEDSMKKPITNRSKVKGSPAVESYSPNEGREDKEDSNTPHMKGSLSKVKKTTVIVNGLHVEDKDKSRKTSDRTDQKPIPNFEECFGTRLEMSLKSDIVDEDLMKKPITNRSNVKDSSSVESSSPNEGREVKEDPNIPHREGSLSKVKKTTVIVNELHDEDKDKSRKTSDRTDQKPISSYEDSLETRSELSLKSDLEDEDSMKKPITKESTVNDTQSAKSSSPKVGLKSRKDAETPDIEASLSKAKDTAVIPVSLKNPRGYCFFNSVVQVLFACRDFVDAIIAYPASQGTDEDKSFVIKFCKLLKAMTNKNKVYLGKRLKKVHELFTESEDGDDVQKCFMSMLTTINNATRTPEAIALTKGEKSAEAFNKHKSRNNGFIFDLFYGQMSNCTTCNLCQHTVHESFQLFKSLPLPVFSDRSGVKLEDCIDCFFQRSEVVMEESMDCKCENGSLNFFTEAAITHSPIYLFIYLNRGSYFEGGLKNNTFVECTYNLDLPTKDGKVPYHIISVIDHMGNHDFGHYYCKCNYGAKDWWLISDEQVENIGDKFENIITKHAIALMYKRENNNYTL